VARGHSKTVASEPPFDSPGESLADGLDPVAATVDGALRGDGAGVRRFLEAIAPTVRRTCRGALSAGHPDLEDTIQEAMFAVVRALPRYRSDGHIRGYVSKIALRVARATRRRSAARWRPLDSIDAGETDELAAPAPAPRTNDDTALIKQIFDDLSATQGEALFMRVVLGYSVGEIASLAGVSSNTVKTRLRLGKNALRRLGQRPGFWRRLFGGWA